MYKALKNTGLILALICSSAAMAQPAAQEAYTWKSVQIVGAGFVPGIIFHPTERDVRYARTDMGGAYRWDARAGQWQPILDWVSYKDRNLMGVESIAVDPSDANRVYLACGTYTNARTPNGAILRSADRGKTFARTDVPFKFGGNEDGRGNGERLVVDPQDGRILYLGTRHDGLWRSHDRGATWTRVASFPDVSEPEPPRVTMMPGESWDQFWQRLPILSDGIVFEKFVPAETKKATPAPTQTIYAGVSLVNRANLFVSKDGGATWSAVAGAPTAYRPMRAALSSDGFLYIAYGSAPGPSRTTNGAVWKLNTRTGEWTEITPEKPEAGKREFGYAAVSVDAEHPETVIASTFSHPNGEEIFRSLDGGASWKPVIAGGAEYDYSLAPYVKPTPIHWLFDIEIDPKNSDHTMFTTGYGGWETFDLTAADRGQPTHWRIMAKGIEESVPLTLKSPAEGAHLVSGIGDYGGFVHWDLDRAAIAGSSAPPRMSNTNWIDVAALKPQTLVRVGFSVTHKTEENLSFSMDGGLTWKSAAAAPTPKSGGGTVAVAADGASWVWTPERQAAYVTHDQGATWTAAVGLPEDTQAIADPAEPSRFYAFSLHTMTLYRSTDGGASFTAEPAALEGAKAITNWWARGDERGGQDRLYAAPGRSGDLWFAAFDGLYHARPAQAGETSAAFSRMPGVEEIAAFGFGKAAPGKTYPAIYLVGTVRGQYGIFRSNDEARTWTRINDDRHQWGMILQITGDPRLYGRVYLGVHGRGAIYGDPVKSAQR